MLCFALGTVSKLILHRHLPLLVDAGVPHVQQWWSQQLVYCWVSIVVIAGGDAGLLALAVFVLRNDPFPSFLFPEKQQQQGLPSYRPQRQPQESPKADAVVTVEVRIAQQQSICIAVDSYSSFFDDNGVVFQHDVVVVVGGKTSAESSALLEVPSASDRPGNSMKPTSSTGIFLPQTNDSLVSASPTSSLCLSVCVYSYRHLISSTRPTDGIYRVGTPKIAQFVRIQQNQHVFLKIQSTLTSQIEGSIQFQFLNWMERASF